ncbi:MAG TPA: serine protease [Pyrinomonadaceae bacterium]|jgi:hypothetical protein
MAGLDIKRLALIHSKVKTSSGDEHVYGTGYFVTTELVLTASHVLSKGLPELIEVRPGAHAHGRESSWVEAEPKPVWENAKLDAALIRVVQPISEDVPLPDWGDMDFQKNQDWDSVAYPDASSEETQNGTEFKTSGLRGTLYAHGGGGQGTRELELGVEDEATLWAGISGAPVFVGEKLVGIIKSSFSSFEQRRLAAVPVEFLRRDPDFRKAIAPKWLQPFPQKTWVLILNQENKYPELTDTVKAAISNRSEDIERTAGRPLEDEPRVVSVTDALESPERLFQFIQAICAAPIMVFDVTDFEPAVMMFLGIRAVVRRGVTLTTTNKSLNESLLSELPFNIQETKLIDLSEEEIGSPKHPLNWIGSAIVKGLTQLQSHPNYLDLPAYNAVRCPEPKDFAGKPLTKDKALMLCSFHKHYTEHYWKYVANKIVKKAAPKTLERMLDISSPRLVGLALYESIRWTPCCIIDWTQWRPNVFFELGVRLACSDIGPISLIEEGEILDERNDIGEANTTASAPTEETGSKPPILNQRHQLIRLLAPTKYKLQGPIEPFDKAFRRYDAIINDQDVSIDDSAIAHNAIYRAIVNSYFWQQEPISRLPHEELSANVQAQLGKDPQKQGRSQVLFSSNPEFAKELRRNVQERWIAAWYYLKGRYAMEEFRSNAELRKQLTTLGEEVAQWLSKTPDYDRIYNEIIEVIDDLGEQ